MYGCWCCFGQSARGLAHARQALLDETRACNKLDAEIAELRRKNADQGETREQAIRERVQVTNWGAAVSRW